MHGLIDAKIAKLGLQCVPWSCEGARHTASMRTRDAKALCEVLSTEGLEAYALADFDDSQMSWVFVFDKEEKQ